MSSICEQCHEAPEPLAPKLGPMLAYLGRLTKRTEQERVVETALILATPIYRPYCGTAARVPRTHPFDGTVLASREVIPILGMTRDCASRQIWPCCEPHQSNVFRHCVQILPRDPSYRRERGARRRTRRSLWRPNSGRPPHSRTYFKYSENSWGNAVNSLALSQRPHYIYRSIADP
jgi:hypothetical protein